MGKDLLFGGTGRNSKDEKQYKQEMHLLKEGTAEGKWEKICCLVNTLQDRGKSLHGKMGRMTQVAMGERRGALTSPPDTWGTSCSLWGSFGGFWLFHTSADRNAFSLVSPPLEEPLGLAFLWAHSSPVFRDVLHVEHQCFRVTYSIQTQACDCNCQEEK